MINWFEDQRIGQVVSQLTGVDNYDDMLIHEGKLRKKLETIVSRIDNKLISFVDDIINRTNKRLSENW